MDAIVEFFLELFFTGLIEGIAYLYSEKYGHGKKIKKEHIGICVGIEILVLFVMFVVGGIACVETEWTSIWAKVIFWASIIISAVQITLGLVLIILKKIRNRNRR